MKEAARYLILSFAILAVIAILVVWKTRDREEALRVLKEVYEADVIEMDGVYTVGCSSDRLVDLVEFSDLLSRSVEAKVLDLTGASNLESFSGIEALLSLEVLVAIDCPKLKTAKGIAKHPKLREIVLVDCAQFEDSSAIAHLPRLETLDFSGCAALERFDPIGLAQLENLYFSNCRNLKGLDVSSLPNLEQLLMDGCSDILEISKLDTLTKLTDFDVSNAESLAHLNGVERLNSLIVLDIRNVSVTDLSQIGMLPNLRVLRMGGNDSIENLEVFSGLDQLRELHMEACSNFSSLAGIPAGLTQYAGFTHCPKLESLEGLENAPGLEQLDFTGCESLSQVGQLGGLRELVQLSLAKCPKVTDISVVEKLEKLVIVMLGGSGVAPAAVEKIHAENEEIIFDFTVSG